MYIGSILCNCINKYHIHFKKKFKYRYLAQYRGYKAKSNEKIECMHMREVIYLMCSNDNSQVQTNIKHHSGVKYMYNKRSPDTSSEYK